MAFLTMNKPKPRHSSRRTLEFGVYFSLIFLAAIPFGIFAWARDVVMDRTLLLRGPLARAWAEADRITPLIFSA
ncbi:MAG: cytochrome PufQ [Paracoccaceae bacterium]